jgi:hypothetical protein
VADEDVGVTGGWAAGGFRLSDMGFLSLGSGARYANCPRLTTQKTQFPGLRK